jgi:hypothetical protein
VFGRILLTPLLLLLGGCTESEDPRNASPPALSGPQLPIVLPIEERAWPIGTAGLIPRNWPEPSAQDWGDLFQTLPAYGELYGIHTPWDGDLKDEIPVQVVHVFGNLGTDSGVEPYVLLGFSEALSPAQVATFAQDHGDAFRETAVRIADRYRPGIMLLGNELNFTAYEKSAAGYEAFVDLITEIRTAIREAHPDILVGAVLQTEMLLGNAGRTGVKREDVTHIIDRLAPRIDVLGLTLFPFLDYDEPSEIPDDYLAPLRAHTDLPFLITETGWPSEPVAGIHGSPQAQIDYLKRLLELLRDEKLAGLMWAFPHDVGVHTPGKLYNSVSLLQNDGTPKAAWSHWQALRELPRTANTP